MRSSETVGRKKKKKRKQICTKYIQILKSNL